MIVEKNNETRELARPVLPRTAPIKRVRSPDLFAGGAEVLIEHEGREYRLRVTRNGKLILTA